jgi:hypothetical protein
VLTLPHKTGFVKRVSHEIDGDGKKKEGEERKVDI